VSIYVGTSADLGRNTQFPWSDVASAEFSIPIFPPPFVRLDGMTFLVLKDKIILLYDWKRERRKKEMKKRK
jgi:hypothetical protein